jgi:NADPH-dependent ferric siderophore reductase
LKAGDTVSYLGVGSSQQEPAPGRPLVFLGDETAIGHFLALRQLAGSGAEICGAVTLSEEHHRDEFGQYFTGWEVQSLKKGEARDYGKLEEWIGGLDILRYRDAMFYLAGNSREVVRLRRLLRQMGVSPGRVKAQGFWN